MPKANPMKGEAEFAGHKLVVDFNGWCSLEGVAGKNVPELLKELQKGLGFLDLRTWVRIFLVEDLSAEETGDLIGGDYEGALAALGSAVEGFFAPVKAENENPRKAA
jgi:hypothetical protein